MFTLPTLLILTEALAIIGLLVTLNKVSSEADQLRRQEHKLKDADQARRKAERILENAREKYQEVINNSYKKAQTIISDAKVFNEDTKQQVLAQLDESIKDITAEIKDEAMEELEVQKEVTQKAVASQYDQANAEIEKYKQDKLVEIESKSVEVLKAVVGKMLSEGIEIKDQEKLLTKALEEAKNAKLF